MYQKLCSLLLIGFFAQKAYGEMPVDLLDVDSGNGLKQNARLPIGVKEGELQYILLQKGSTTEEVHAKIKKKRQSLGFATPIDALETTKLLGYSWQIWDGLVSTDGPGRLELHAQIGQTIHISDLLFTIEAMKMVTSVRSTVAGNIIALFNESGSTVESGSQIVEVRPSKSDYGDHWTAVESSLLKEQWANTLFPSESGLRGEQQDSAEDLPMHPRQEVVQHVASLGMQSVSENDELENAVTPSNYVGIEVDTCLAAFDCQIPPFVPGQDTEFMDVPEHPSIVDRHVFGVTTALIYMGTAPPLEEYSVHSGWLERLSVIEDQNIFPVFIKNLAQMVNLELSYDFHYLRLRSLGQRLGDVVNFITIDYTKATFKLEVQHDLNFC